VATLRQPGDIAVLENTRFFGARKRMIQPWRSFRVQWAIFYVNDAFSAAHRAHASTEGLAHKLPAYAGRSMERELEALQAALGAPASRWRRSSAARRSRPSSMCSPTWSRRSIKLIIGGGMANTFLAARGVDVGKSLCEHDLAETAEKIIRRGGSRGMHDPSAL
jgi:phosphoglycerate kinase